MKIVIHIWQHRLIAKCIVHQHCRRSVVVYRKKCPEIICIVSDRPIRWTTKPILWLKSWNRVQFKVNFVRMKTNRIEINLWIDKSSNFNSHDASVSRFLLISRRNLQTFGGQPWWTKWFSFRSAAGLGRREFWIWNNKILGKFSNLGHLIHSIQLICAYIY